MTSQRHTTEPEPPADRLLAAARACILDVGLRRTTLADVARRAGVSRMTVYRQYGDLQAIVAALLTAEVVELITRCRDAVDDLPTARARIVEGVARTVEALVHHPLYRTLLDRDPELLLPYVVDRFGSTQRAAVDVAAGPVAAGQQDGSVRAGDVRLIASCLLLTAQSFVFSARVVEGFDPAGEGDAGAELRRLLDGYLR